MPLAQHIAECPPRSQQAASRIPAVDQQVAVLAVGETSGQWLPPCLLSRAGCQGHSQLPVPVEVGNPRLALRNDLPSLVAENPAPGPTCHLLLLCCEHLLLWCCPKA